MEDRIKKHIDKSAEQVKLFVEISERIGKMSDKQIEILSEMLKARNKGG